MKNTFKENRYFILFYGALFTLFLWPLLLFRQTFIYGDYWQQHYPWAYVYSQSLKSGKLPYWIPGVAGGFPLVAEGQIGAYYLFNLISYFLLPFSVAYNFGILFHVLFGGTGFYKYGQKIGLSKEAATLTAALFSFSSAYGGCFYNTASLRVLSWLPWGLLACGNLAAAPGIKRFFWISVLGAVFSQMWTAGSQQLALYAAGYLFCLWVIEQRGKRLIDFLAANLLGILLSLPQWAATLELVPVSVRSSETAAFALSGSVLPPAAVSLIYPEWGIFLKVSFYLGAASILLLLVSLVSKKTFIEKIHIGAALFFFFLALGRYNPLYVFFIEKFSLTGLRSPSKFLFFTTISLAVVTGIGFDRLDQVGRDEKLLRRFKKYLGAILAAVFALPWLGRMATEKFKSYLLNFAHQSATQAFFAKRNPTHGLSYYQAKADAIYHELGRHFQYSDPWNLLAPVFFLSSTFVILKILGKGSRDFWKKIVLPAVLFIDLLVFGIYLGVGFTGNLKTFPNKPPDSLMETIRVRQSFDRSALVEWAQDPNDEILPANTNLLYSLNHAGGYSPLLIKRYYEFSKDLGISDSSLGRQPLSEDIWKKETGVIEALGVGQILSNEKLSLPDLKLITVMSQSRFANHRQFEQRRYIYSLNQILPLVYAVYDWKKIGNETERLDYLKSGTFRPFEEAVIEDEPENLKPRPGLFLSKAEIISEKELEITAEIDALSDAVLVFRSVYYPRWKAEVDGRRESLVPVNHAFSGLFLNKGKHSLHFFYDDKPQKFLELAATTAWIMLCVGNYICFRKGF